LKRKSITQLPVRTILYFTTLVKPCTCGFTTSSFWRRCRGVK